MYTSNEILDHIERDKQDIEDDTEQMYTFRRISAHQGPLRTSDKDYNGSRYKQCLGRMGDWGDNI